MTIKDNSQLFPLAKQQVNMRSVLAVMNAAEQLRDASSELIPSLLRECKKIDWIYNPLEYAWRLMPNGSVGSLEMGRPRY